VNPYRTVISVPGNKPSWFAKAAAAGADCLCLDLEDSVPPAEKDTARAAIRDAIGLLAEQHPRVGLFVRPNALGTGETGADLEAVVVPGLTGVFAPKVGSAVDVHKYDALVDHFERRGGVRGIEYILPIETIQGIQHCEEIAMASPRVGALIGPTAEHADIARAVGYEWSPEGLESRYHRTRILLAARAAGVHPLTALWERIRDLDGLETFTVDSRRMGFRGQIVLHPTHVPVVNRVYTPDPTDIDFYRGLLKAYEEAEAAGLGAAMYGDIHIDKAHADKATEWLARVDALVGLHGGI
jgi:citrate lyase subunit beta / citryl-CoA lyase